METCDGRVDDPCFVTIAAAERSTDGSFRRDSGVLVYWCNGVLMYGVLVHGCLLRVHALCVGVLVYCVLSYWCSGVLVYWCMYWCIVY